MKPRRVVLRTTGEAGTVTGKVINGCLWVKMDDGRTLSGHKDYWKPERKRDIEQRRAQ